MSVLIDHRIFRPRPPVASNQEMDQSMTTDESLLIKHIQSRGQ